MYFRASKITRDFALNIVASLLSTGIMQLVVYPRFAIELSSNDYGIMLTMMGYVNVVTLAFGNNLCNARLLQQKKYEAINKVGDFQLFLLLAVIIASSVIAVCCVLIRVSGVLLLGVVVSTAITVCKSYYLVIFRINVDYVRNLIANAIIGIGFVLGSILLIKVLSWPWVFSFAYSIGILYVFLTTRIVTEPFSKTPLFKDSGKVAITLMCSGLLGNVITYLDRFIIYPVLGGGAVSTYSTAAFFSKSLNLVLAPITSVVLSYLTAERIQINKKRFIVLNMLMVIAGLLFWLGSITVGDFITGVLYPSLIGDAKKYIPLVSAGIIIGIMAIFSNTIVLAYAPVKWQTILPTVQLILYLVSCYCLITIFGLRGLCFGVIITNFFSLSISAMVAFIYISKREKGVIAL